jgi:excisionase family DNA binding protein
MHAERISEPPRNTHGRRRTAEPAADVNSASEAPVLGLRVAADRVGLAPPRLLEYVRRGEVEAHQIRRRWRFSEAALDAFLAPAPEWSIQITAED